MSDFKILIAEDEAITAILLNDTLREMGYMIIDMVATGENVIDTARRHSPDLILMDICLADKISGIEAARRIREISASHIIFMTGYQSDEVKSQALAAGGFAYLEKPIDINEIDNIIKNRILTKSQ